MGKSVGVVIISPSQSLSAEQRSICDDAARKLATHVVAIKPKYLRSDDIFQLNVPNATSGEEKESMVLLNQVSRSTLEVNNFSDFLYSVTSWKTVDLSLKIICRLLPKILMWVL